MGSPFQYKDLGELMGSWPLSFAPGTTSLQIQPNALSTKAELLGSVQETSDGYLVGGLSLNVYADVGGVPTLHAVSFPAGGGSGLTTDHYTLAEVIARFAASAPPLPANTAQNSNNFLLLQSQTSGQDSYLRLESISGAEGVFQVLGLQPEVEARGGGLRHTQHIDPTRQLAQPGQLSMAHGESFSADVVNRMAMQLAVNAGVSRGTLDLRKVAVRRLESFAATGASVIQINTGNPTEGVYTGPVATPSLGQLRDTIAVLDTNGNQFIREYQDTLDGPASDLDFSIEADTGKQLVTSPSFTFTAADVASNRHVVVSNFAVATALNDVPLKIIEFKSANQAVVLPINPVDGSVLQITEVGRTGSRVQVYTLRAQIEGFYQEIGAVTELEQQQIAVVSGSGAVSEVETPNRIRVDTAQFVNAKPGDRVSWTGAVPATPYNNNGVYRIARVVDEIRLELVGEDYEPVYLNKDSSGSLGTVTVTSDGDFFSAPFVQFAQPTPGNLAAGIGAVPQSGDNFQLSYYVASTFKSAISSDPTALAGSVRFSTDEVAATQAALMRLAGPSVTSFDELLHGTYDLSLEKIDFRVDKEHYEETGRHSDIRPDTIDMFPGVDGTTHTLRMGPGDSETQVKFRFLTDAGVLRYSLQGEGPSLWATDTPVAAALPNLASGNVGHNFQHGTGSEKYRLSLASTGAGDSLLKLAILDDGAAGTLANVLGVSKDGSIGVNLGTAAADTGTEGLAQANFHIRGRSIADTELLRMEGFDDTDNTVALTFKPRRLQPFFGFVEVDHEDPSNPGDWSMNFVMTTDAEGDSDGALSEAYFRFVRDAGGTPAEISRFVTAGLGLVDISQDNAATGTHARKIRWLNDTDAGEVAATIEVEKVAAGFDSHRLRFWTSDSPVYAGLYINADGGVSINDTATTGYPFVSRGTGTSVAGIFKSDQTSSVIRFFNTTATAVGDVGIGAAARNLSFRVDQADRGFWNANGLSLGHANNPLGVLDFGIGNFATAGEFGRIRTGYERAVTHDPGVPTIAQAQDRRQFWMIQDILVSGSQVFAGERLRMQTVINRWDDGDGGALNDANDTWAGLRQPGWAITSNAYQNRTTADDTWTGDTPLNHSMGFVIGTPQNYRDFSGEPLSTFKFLFRDPNLSEVWDLPNWGAAINLERDSDRDLQMIMYRNTAATLPSRPANRPSNVPLHGQAYSRNWSAMIPMTMPKAWGTCRRNAVASTLPNSEGVGWSLGGFDLFGVALLINFNTSMGNDEYCIVGSATDLNGGANTYSFHVRDKTPTSFLLLVKDQTGAAIDWETAGDDIEACFLVFSRY